MFKRLQFRLLAAVVFCLLLPASVYADAVVITNNMFSALGGFSWTVTFSGLPAPGTTFPILAQYANAERDWGREGAGDARRMQMRVIGNANGVFALVVDGRHLQGPHGDLTPGNVSIDINPGFAFVLEAQNINALGAENKSLDFDVVAHLHFPGDDHSDAVELFGRRVGDDFSFTVTGTHRDSPVPEPASMLLLGTGLVGIAMKLRKRSKGRRSG